MGRLVLDDSPSLLKTSRESSTPGWTLAGSDDRCGDRALASLRSEPRLSRCLVTPVDGLGRGSIVISINQRAQRRTAAFLCDVQRGICDVVGDVEPESARAGSLLDDVDQQSGADGARDVPELAVGLLAGSLMLCGPSVPPVVRDWIDGTLGPDFGPEAFPAKIPGVDPSAIPWVELPARVHVLFESCPSWLDASPLTFELAEEINLREDRHAAGPDPDRDAGLYRFLFEHRLIHRIDLYRRMLLWMAWVWRCSARLELSRLALALATQLSDEQYAVPSHPFARGAHNPKSARGSAPAAHRTGPALASRQTATVVGILTVRGLERRKKTGAGAAALEMVTRPQLPVMLAILKNHHFLVGLAAPLAGAAAALAAGLPLAPFFSTAFFFLALSRASPIAQVSS